MTQTSDGEQGTWEGILDGERARAERPEVRLLRRQGAVAPAPNSVKRPAFDRMVKIHGWLQDGRCMNSTEIAKELSASVRTVARDLDFMRDRWELPIEYDERRHGFYYTQKVDRLPWVPVTQAELFAVCITRKVLGAYEGMPFHKPLELAFAKLTQNLDNKERYFLENLDMAFSVRPFAPEDADVRVLEVLTGAVAERRGLRFDYRKPGDKEAETRHFYPYHFVDFEGRLYLMGYDLVREEVRTFVPGRMRNLEVTEEWFVKPKDFDWRKELESAFGVMAGKGDYQVVIEMDAWLTDIVGSRRLHSSQVVEALAGGGSRVRLRLGCLEEIEQEVLKWGAHATVVGPQELRERLYKTATELVKRYGNGGM